MCVYRQALCLCLGLMLGGCYNLDPMPLMFSQSPFSQNSQAKGNAICAPLFIDGAFSRLEGKMPLQPNDIPSAEMLSLNLAPDAQDIAAIQALEGAARTCLKMREAASLPTSASEDILQARISKLRFALYRGDLPYAVYNYGVAQALKNHNDFILEGERATVQGRLTGQDNAMSAMMLSQFAMLGAKLSAYDQASAQTARPLNWTCKTSSYPSGNTYVDCY